MMPREQGELHFSVPVSPGPGLPSMLIDLWLNPEKGNRKNMELLKIRKHTCLLCSSGSLGVRSTAHTGMLGCAELLAPSSYFCDTSGEREGGEESQRCSFSHPAVKEQ